MEARSLGIRKRVFSTLPHHNCKSSTTTIRQLTTSDFYFSPELSALLLIYFCDNLVRYKLPFFFVLFCWDKDWVLLCSPRRPPTHDSLPQRPGCCDYRCVLPYTVAISILQMRKLKLREVMPLEWDTHQGRGGVKIQTQVFVTKAQALSTISWCVLLGFFCLAF